MALPFPAPLADGFLSLRVYKTGTATANYTDNQIVFTHPTDSTKQAWSRAIRITAGASDLTFSFDGVNDHGVVKATTTVEYLERCEGGIAIKGAGTFTLEAW